MQLAKCITKGQRLKLQAALMHVLVRVCNLQAYLFSLPLFLVRFNLLLSRQPIGWLLLLLLLRRGWLLRRLLFMLFAAAFP